MSKEQRGDGLKVNSVVSHPMPLWMSAAAVTLGIILEYKAVRGFAAMGADYGAMMNMTMGLVCIYGAGISRRLYISSEGVVREMHSWGRVLRRVLPWSDVSYVSLAFRGDKMMVFFEVDATGWKVLFSRDQENAVLDVLDEMIPDVEVEVLGRR
jgi:hypothetical protein